MPISMWNYFILTFKRISRQVHISGNHKLLWKLNLSFNDIEDFVAFTDKR